MLRKLMFVVALLVLPAQAMAASRVWITEFAAAGATMNNVPLQIATLPPLAYQTPLDISGGVQSSSAFSAQTRYIRIMCEVQCAVKSGSGATTSNMLMPALSAEYFGVQSGDLISVIAAP